MHAYVQEIHKTHENQVYEQEIHRIHAYEQESYQSHAYEQRIHVYKLKDCKFLEKKPMFLTQSSNQLLRIQYTMTEFSVEAGAEPIPIPCEPSESEKNET